MFTKYNSKEDNFIESIRNNREILHNLGIMNSEYVSLLSHLPMNEKEFNFFITLKNTKERYGYLSRYLLKCCNKVKLSNFIIYDFYNTKKHYNKLLAMYNFKYKDTTYKNLVQQKGIELEKLNEYFEIYTELVELENYKSILKQKTTLILRMVVEKYIENLSRKNKIYDLLD